LHARRAGNQNAIMGTRREASTVVLAGGRSNRMGEPKPALPFGAATLLGRVVAELKTAFDDVVIVAAPLGALPLIPDSPVTIVRDERAYQGPVGAIARGLEAARYDIAFACSCDLPMLSARVALEMVARLADYDAVIAEVGGVLQPLHAVYRRRCAAALRAIEARGEQRLQAIAAEVRTRRLSEAGMREIDPELTSFMNINTPEDYSRALELAGLAPPRRDY
jgi:molybdopterin-guanine dinucleotide biosynthesis protein A